MGNDVDPFAVPGSHTPPHLIVLIRLDFLLERTANIAWRQSEFGISILKSTGSLGTSCLLNACESQGTYNARACNVEIREVCAV